MAYAILRNHRISVGRGESYVRKVFVSAVVDQFEGPHLAEMKKHGRGLDQIAKLFCVDKGTVSKWKNGKQRPAWERICLAYAAFDLHYAPVIPRGRQVAREALRRCVESFARDWLKAASDATLSIPELALLHYGCGNVGFLRKVTEVSLDNGFTSGWEELERTASRIFERAAQEEVGVAKLLYSSDDFPHARALSRVLERWNIAWFATHLLNPYHWQYEELTR